MNIQLVGTYMEPIADKKKAIFKSTMELVREHGFHGTPMSMVAKHAGVAAGTIYHYFESKDKLICELFNYAQQQVIAVVEQEDCATIPFKACFANLWMGLYTFYRNNQDILRFFEQFVNSPYSAAMPRLEEDKFYTLLFAFFERGIQEDQLREVSPRTLGMLTHSSILSIAKLTASGRLSLDSKELEQVHELLWSGMARHH
ncbi:TetR/AcrR family transcriptional regulator [uncultured Pontibacter sp.]|uniref:TetR/AcrR family transcriptional regulator n=1 Tax=uncultured Pontibacter sp. TaxID=453356 RepID=UPI00261A0EAC|nr:TetR/AcrR family transcriptional regulator [uncultured Pontibacter sp.]